MDRPMHPQLPEGVSWEWFCKESKQFDKVDVDLSKKLSEKHGCKLKECYHNAWTSDVIGLYDYYEGYVIKDNLPLAMAHSWLVDRNSGKVIDTTLVIPFEFEGKNISSVGDHYIGVQIDRTWLNKIAFKLKRTGDFLGQWRKERHD